MNEKIAYVFDFDKTLVDSDYKKEIETLFKTLDFVKPIKKAIYFFKKILSEYENDVYILTTRHITLKFDLSNYLRINFMNIHCTNLLSTEELKLVNLNKENTDKFLEKSIKDKIEFLNNLSNKYDKIKFYDDMIEDFIKNKDFISNKVELNFPNFDNLC